MRKPEATVRLIKMSTISSTISFVCLCSITMQVLVHLLLEPRSQELVKKSTRLRPVFLVFQESSCIMGTVVMISITGTIVQNPVSSSPPTA